MRFKIWDYKNKKWLYPIHKGYLGHIFEPYLVQNGELCFKLIGIDGIKDGDYHSSYFKKYGYEFKVIQYTGFKDENCIEIYDGDIVERVDRTPIAEKYGKRDIGVVKFYKLGWVMESSNDKFCYNIGLNDTFFNTYSYKVVGNIYETPDLLK